MKHVYHKKIRKSGVVQMHVDPPLTPLIKINLDDNSDKYFIKLKLCRDLTSARLDLYDFKIDLFENGNTEEFLFFICNFIMTIVEWFQPQMRKIN